MTLKHTPGPWRFGKRADDDEDQGGIEGPGRSGVCHFGNAESFDCAPGIAPDEADMALVLMATTAPHECSDPSCPGAINARKLAAFDEMLEALKAEERARQIEATHDNECSYSSCGFRGCPHYEVGEGLERAKGLRRAAIAKANGAR